MRKKEITSYVERFVLDFFLSMLNKNNQGQKFTWNLFPQMVSKLVMANLFADVPHPTKKEIKFAKEKAIDFAKYLIKKSNLKDDKHFLLVEHTPGELGSVNTVAYIVKAQDKIEAKEKAPHAYAAWSTVKEIKDEIIKVS